MIATSIWWWNKQCSGHNVLQVHNDIADKLVLAKLLCLCVGAGTKTEGEKREPTSLNSVLFCSLFAAFSWPAGLYWRRCCMGFFIESSMAESVAFRPSLLWFFISCDGCMLWTASTPIFSQTTACWCPDDGRIWLIPALAVTGVCLLGEWHSSK